jgi:hypothetical protein
VKYRNTDQDKIKCSGGVDMQTEYDYKYQFIGYSVEVQSKMLIKRIHS